MKHFLSVLAILLIISSVKAQSKDEAKVEAAVQQLRQAMLDANKTQLEALVSDDLSYGHSSGKMEDKAAFVDALVSGRSDFVTMELTNQTVKVSGKTALVRHNLTAETNDNGTRGTARIGVLLVWQKVGRQWKLLGRQAYRL